MLNLLPFTQLRRPSSATLLPPPHITGLGSQPLSLPANRVGRLLLFAAGAWLATACTSESSPEQPATDASAPVADDAPAEESSPDDGNDECQKMQDMWDALPKLETYKQFKLDETNCLAPSRVIS